MIKSYYEFINENKTDNIVKISTKLRKILQSMNNKFAMAILKTTYNVDELRDNYADNIDIEEDGMLSYDFKLKKSGNRSKIKPSKILTKIVLDPKDYLFKNGVTQKDIELFMNKWKSLSSDNVKVDIWKGEKILDAFNYTNMIDLKRFSMSCANFNCNNGYPEPVKSDYDIYVKNPKNISVGVVMEDDMIRGRRIIVEGKQYETNGDFKKGTHYTILNPFYGDGGEGSIHDQILLNYIKKNKENVILNTYGDKIKLVDNEPINGIFITKLQKTKFPRYAAFDKFYVNFKEDLIASSNPYTGKWEQAYKAGYVGKPKEKKHIKI